MPGYDYFKQYVSEMERIKAKTIHESHIEEFKVMCAKMIGDATPDIIKRAKEEYAQESKAQQRQDIRQDEREPKSSKQPEAKVDVRVDTDGIIAQIRKAIKKAFG